MTLRNESLRRVSLARLLLFVVLGLVGFVEPAGADVPVLSQSSTGPRVHHSYVETLYASTSNYVGVSVTTPSKPSHGCPFNTSQFNSGPDDLKPNGSPSASRYFSTKNPQLKFTVTGTFTSP